MELSATAIGVIIVLVMMLPVIYLIVTASGKDKKVIRTIKKLSQGQGVNLTVVDIVGNCVIGLDPASRKLVYATKSHPDNGLRIIDIENVKDFRAKSIRQTDKTLDWVGLEIVETTGKSEIPFYNEHDENELATDAFVCLQNAKRWENTVRPLLKAS